jgi:hypothetical protein
MPVAMSDKSAGETPADFLYYLKDYEKLKGGINFT